MIAGGLENLYIETLQPGHPVKGLRLGKPEFQPLKTFFERDAKAYERQGLGRTYVAFEVDGNRPRAYLTLVCGEVVVDEGGDPLVGGAGLHYPYRFYPAIKIARLAVDKRLQFSGVGRKLVNLALGITKDQVCAAVGCRFVMVDAKRESVGFYLRCGFTMLDSMENKLRKQPVLYVDLSKLP